ncbi:MAG TPA: amino acid adenylation domain-containing protein, partial [Bryobacteraceae bacterium]|nr:amino acid adenylation domain-containing protein [Bryobacteraceae bacterium]
MAAFARARRLPLKTVLLAAHLRALEELTGERDLVTGLVSNGRPETTDSTQTLGLFLNTIPLRWKSPSGSWEKFCEAVFQRESELLPFRRFPLAEMDRSFGTAPFETSFNFIQFHVLQAFAKASRWGLLSSSSEEAVEFPLSVNFSSSVDGDVIHLGILYDAGKYPREQVEGMARLLDDVLTATVEHPRHAHRDFEASTGDRDRGFLLLANATDTPVDRLAPARIAALANAHPQRTSVLAEGEALTYGDLERWSGQVAHHLITKGLERDQPVALLMERSLELIVAMLGIWKAGAFYVPIEPDLPPARAEAILAESGARYTLTREIVAGLRSSPAVANRPVEIHPEQLAYVLFTSGSTGKPKGVGVRHFALANQIQWLEKSFPLTPDDSVLQKTPYGFDASLWEFWFPLCCGAKLVMAPPDSHRDPRILASIVQRERISILQLVPTMLEALTEEPELDRCASLRILFCGGEVLKTATVRAFQKKLPIPVVNLYGPTEATIQSSAKEFDDHETGATMGIGWPLDNNRYYVLNSSLQQAPVGAAGELHIGGSVLARGYWRQPDLTAERFLPDPFSSQPGGRMYRTGDRVRWLPDGRLEFLGRLDDQVKIGGSRIELGEVESALAQCARGRRAAVLPINRQLVAFVEAKEAIDAPAIRSALRERLPSYMVPARIVAVEVWPLLASGKTNRRALAAMEPRAESSRPRSLPTSEKERLLLALWQRLLPGAVASIEENFFELGGDSILSLQLVALARKQGLALTPKQVFDHPTIRDLARVAGKPEEGPGAPAVFEGSLPLTPIQLAFFEQKPPTPNYWNQSVLLTLKEPFSVDRLKDSVLALLERHDVFRLRFRFDGDRWSQHYGPLCGSWEERDCAREDLERRCSEAQAGLDIENGPLFRAVLFRLSDGGFRLLLAVHHLIVDGVSWRILLEEIASNSRPALTMPFGVWARRLASPEVSSQMKRDLDFWIEQTAPVRALPTDFSNGPNTEGSASTVDGELTAEETSALLASAPASLKATAEELLLLSVATAVSEWIGESAVLLNVESNGREDATGDLDLTSTVGWFTALYPLRLDVPQTASAEERLSGLKPQMRARPKAAASYGALRYQVKSPELQTAHAEISINFLGQFDSTFPDDAPFLPAEESGGEQYAADSPRQHLLDFIAGVSGGKLNLQVRYSRNIHARGTVARLLDSVLETLRSALALCGAPRPSAWSASDFPLARLDESEFRHLAETHWPFVDLLPLTPVQEGMLFHSVEQGPESGVYVQQLVIHAHGMCDLPRLREAWQALLRYPQLRASFARHDLRTPIAVIPPEAPMEWQHVDWRENSEADRSFAEWLDQDRLRRFVLEQAPLLRLAVFQLANDEWRLVWTHHHALLDGWSIPTILAEVLSHYAGIPTDPMPSLAWREYLDWLSRQDPASAESFWRDHLSGFTEPLLLSERESSTREAVSSASANWTSGETATLLEFARGRQVTLNTLIQAAWAFVIGRTARTEDVVFGATVSGRPTELAGAESAIGMYINTLPVRCSLAPAQTVDQWLLSVQSNQQRVLEHQHSRLVDIHRWSDCAGQPLFESIVVFESYPMDAVAGQLTGNFTIREVRAVEQNHYPLSLYVLPGREIRFTLMFECSRIPAKLASRLLEQFQFVLRSLPRARFVGELGLALEVAASVPGPGDDARSQPQAFVPERFERIAMRTPDSFALCFGEERLTYRELHRRVLRRARELRARNVRQETLTAIFLERSVDMVVSLLATLCAGG